MESRFVQPADVESDARSGSAFLWRRLLAEDSREPSARAATENGRRLFREPADRRSPRKVKTDSALRFFHEVLGLEYLHYGLWEREDPLDMAGLRDAQQRYAERLLELVPPGVRTILDVGSGTGRMSQALSERGCTVEGLSPDPYQAKLFAQRVGTQFHLGRFQEFWPERSYDLVLMSESSQYVWLESLFPAVLRSGAGGYLLIADYFSVGPRAGNGANGANGVERSGHRLDDLLAAAERHGLVLEHQEDVTEKVLPTLTLASGWLRRYVSPAAIIARDAFDRRHRWLMRLGRFLLRRRLESLERATRLLDVETFRRYKRYQFLRYRVPR